MVEESIRIFEIHKDRILKQAAAVFDFKLDNLKRLGSFESFVYEFEKENRHYILKITHSIRRTKELILGELEWVNYLADNGVSVCRAMKSADNELVEKIEADDSYFLVYVYEKTPGDFTGPADWDNVLFKRWGQVIGRMNRLAKDFKPSKPSFKRFHWYEDDSLKAEKFLPLSQQKVIEICNGMIEKLKSLSTDNVSYGMIHSDLHHGNFKVNGGNITVFDFDDCHYNYYAYDIAIPIYYALLDKTVGIDNIPFAENFMNHFMEGYRLENDIDSSWLARIPDFLKLRQLDLYIVIHRENCFEENEWCRRFMGGKREKIENNVPVIDLDFTRF